MSSLPLEQQSPPSAPMVVAHQAYSSHAGGGSVGPLIAVLAVIAILGVAAGLIGRLCAGRSIFGRGDYDLEGWIERRCASCVDGRIDPPSPPPSANTNGATVGPVPIVIHAPPATAAAAAGGKQHPAAARGQAAEP